MSTFLINLRLILLSAILVQLILLINLVILIHSFAFYYVFNFVVKYIKNAKKILAILKEVYDCWLKPIMAAT